MRLASVLIALAWTPAAWGAVQIHPDLQGQLLLDTDGFHRADFAKFQLNVTSSISRVFDPPRPWEEQGVVEFDLRHHSPIEQPIYFRFYLSGLSGPAIVAPYWTSADGLVTGQDFDDDLVHGTDFDNVAVPLATLAIPDNVPKVQYATYNLEVTDLFNDAIGGWLGFNFSTDLGGRYWSPLDQTVVTHDGMATLPLMGALTLGTELLGPPEFPIPEPASWLIWCAIAAVATARKLRGTWQ